MADKKEGVDQPQEPVKAPAPEKENRFAATREDNEHRSAVLAAHKSIGEQAAARGVDLEALEDRLARRPNDIYALDVPEEELVGPAEESNLREAERQAADAERMAAGAFPEFDNVDPLIRARDAVQRRQELAHLEGLTRTLRGAVLPNDEGIPAVDENNLPPEEARRRADLVAAQGYKR